MLIALVSMLVPVAVAATAWSRLRPRLAALTGVAAAVSLTATLIALTATPPPPGTDALALAEGLALILLAGLITRHAPPRQAVWAAPAAGLASSVWLLRSFTPASPLEAFGVCAFWALGALAAAAVGGYLRHLDIRQARAVTGARTALRLRLAGELHDFVAHDISEMLAHAQAGRVTGDSQRALERVEEAGQRALSTLDRCLDTLREDTPPPHDNPDTPASHSSRDSPALHDIREAADRFSASGPAHVDLLLDPALTALTVPADTAALAYRIVVEGLTNVRRHAPHATRVTLKIRPTPGTLEITMTNDGVTGPPPARPAQRGGTGLTGLTTLTHAQGGDLTATRADDGRWSLTAHLPLTQWREWSPESSSPTTSPASAKPSG